MTIKQKAMTTKRKYKTCCQKDMLEALDLALKSVAEHGSYNNAAIARLKGIPEKTLADQFKKK